MTNFEAWRQGLTPQTALEVLYAGGCMDCESCPARQSCREWDEAGEDMDCRETIARWFGDEARTPHPSALCTATSARGKEGNANIATLCMTCVESFTAAGFACRRTEEEAKRRVCRMCGAAGWFDNYEVKRLR